MKKIAYFQIFGGPPIEASVREMLVATFPEYSVKPIIIIPRLRKRLWAVAWNCLVTVKEHGVAIVSGKRSFKSGFLTTTYLFSEVKKLAQRELSQPGDEFAFSFQLQSLFDASVPGIPHYVYTDHTHMANLEYPGFDTRRLNSKKWLALEHQIYAHAEAIFTRSSNITKSLVDDYGCPESKVDCVYVGTNTTPIATTPTNETHSDKHVLFVGTDWQRKGGPVLLKAFSLVLKKHPDAMLTIVGCSPETDLPNCRVMGRLSVDRLSQFYSSASVFCLPTLHEPFGVVFVEAMSYRLPVVATPVGAIPDMVTEETGILVAQNDETALANALTELLADPVKAQRFGENGFQLVTSRYNWDYVGKAVRKRIGEHQQLSLLDESS